MSNKRDPREWRSARSQLRAISLEPCEIDEKIGTIIADPLYRWRGDTILPTEQIQAKTAVGQEDAELPAEQIPAMTAAEPKDLTQQVKRVRFRKERSVGFEL